MRLLFALFLPLLLAAAAAPADWSATSRRTPAGTFVTGNPAARVKLVEYGSYTCSHCAAFSTESEAMLTRWLRSGSTSIEFRNLIRDQVDLAAAIVARCTGPRFAATSAAIFAAQPDWLPRASEFQARNGARLAMYPELARLRALADGAGLVAFGKAGGLTGAAIDRCFADQAEVDRILAVTAAAPASVKGTPSFFLNGKPVASFQWSGVEPALRAAGAR